MNVTEIKSKFTNEIAAAKAAIETDSSFENRFAVETALLLFIAENGDGSIAVPVASIAPIVPVVPIAPVVPVPPKPSFLN